MKLFGKILLGLLALLIAAILAFRTPDTDPAEMRAKYGAVPSQFVALANGQTVHLRDEGPRDAPAIILIHGSNADLHTWQTWVDGLKRDYRVIRFDQRGHGLTGPAKDGDYTLAAFVEDVEDIVESLKLEEFVVAGNSMGGRVAFAYAMQHPEMVDGVVMVDSSGAPITRRGSGAVGFTIAKTPILRNIVAHVTPRWLVERSLQQTVRNQAIVTDAVVDRYWELLRYPGNREATIAQMIQPRTAFDEDVVEAMSRPVLLMWGEEDTLSPVEGGLWYQQHLPNSKLVLYPGYGHLPHEEVAQQSLADLREWLATLDLADNAAEPSETKPVQAK